MIRFPILLGALLAFCGIAQARVLVGSVSRREDQRPLSELRVRAFGARAHASALRMLLAEGSTELDGSFRLDTGASVPELLVLEGTEGPGRIRLAPEDEEALRLFYPVRTTVLLLHDNDLHFNFNQREQFAAEVERIRASHRNVFLLNAGDTFIRGKNSWNVPTPEFYAEQGGAIIERMNVLRYDAMTLGNHDLDYVGDLTRQALGKADFPLLAANIARTTDHLPPWKSFVVLRTENDLTLGVLGLTCINFTKPGLAMADPLQTALAYRDALAHCTVKVGLTHLGYLLDQVLARSACGFDVILGGHCHTLLKTAVMADGVLIAQAGGTPANRRNPVDPSRPKYLGVVTLVIENDRIVEKRGRVHTFP